jgi:hypothetical protein
MPSGEGLTIADGNMLYVTENGITTGIPRISVWGLSMETPVTATLVGYITSPDYEAPTTSGVAGDTIYSVNAGSVSTGVGEEDLSVFAETFQIVGVNRDTVTLIPPSTDTSSDDADESAAWRSSGLSALGFISGLWIMMM